MSLFGGAHRLGVERTVGRKVTDDPQRPRCYPRGKHSGERTPGEQYVRQTGLPARLPRELTLVLESGVGYLENGWGVGSL